jgi:CheY-like chemotaxis protein
MQCSSKLPGLREEGGEMEIAGKAKVLVVDDEQTIANTLSWVLDKEGYETRAAYSGEGALEIARSFAPDILICDFFMAGMNGLDAAIRIVDTYPSCKVLLVSGHISIAHLAQQAAVSGYDFSYLAKPVHPRTLLDVLRELRPES